MSSSAPKQITFGIQTQSILDHDARLNIRVARGELSGVNTPETNCDIGVVCFELDWEVSWEASWEASWEVSWEVS